MSLIRTESINKSYSGRKIIEDINIHVEKGEIVSLLGVSGAGKTTLFHIIAGLTEPDSGRVFLEDEDITSRPGKIAYMLQKDLLMDHKKVIDNVALPLVLRGMKKEDARNHVNPLFEQFGLEGYQYKYTTQLSGGMKQRAALLRTYMASSGTALLDEPFSALDTITKEGIHRWYLGIMEEIQLATLLVTHDIDEAILLSDRVYILKGKPGRIVAEIEIEEEKPRSSDFQLSEKFLKYKRHILSML